MIENQDNSQKIKLEITIKINDKIITTNNSKVINFNYALIKDIDDNEIIMLLKNYFNVNFYKIIESAINNKNYKLLDKIFELNLVNKNKLYLKEEMLNALEENDISFLKILKKYDIVPRIGDWSQTHYDGDLYEADKLLSLNDDTLKYSLKNNIFELDDIVNFREDQQSLFFFLVNNLFDNDSFEELNIIFKYALKNGYKFRKNFIRNEIQELYEDENIFIKVKYFRFYLYEMYKKKYKNYLKLIKKENKTIKDTFCCINPIYLKNEIKYYDLELNKLIYELL